MVPWTFILARPRRPEERTTGFRRLPARAGTRFCVSTVRYRRVVRQDLATRRDRTVVLTCRWQASGFTPKLPFPKSEISIGRESALLTFWWSRRCALH